jgi:hypothetical protein
MKRQVLSIAVSATCAIGAVAQADTDEAARVVRQNMHPFANASGYAATHSTAGFIDTANPFF